PDAGQGSVGQMSEAVNQLLDHTEDLQLFHRAHDRIQSALLRLLDDVHAVAEGDLTHDVTRSSDLPEQVTEGFANLGHRLRQTIRAAQASAVNASAAAKHAQLLTAAMAEESATQAEPVARAVGLLDALTNAGERVTRNAEGTVSAVQLTMHAVRDGNVT